MKSFLMCLLIVALGGCGQNCPVTEGDKVLNKSTGQTGTVLSIGSGGGTQNCTIAVFHNDGTYSKSGNAYGDNSTWDVSQEYVYNWKYSKSN